jgi:hypothetical protein
MHRTNGLIPEPTSRGSDVKTITLLAVAAMLLQAAFGTTSSVGGPMTILLILFITMLAVGIHEAWSNRRGVLGWIVTMVASIIGCFLAASVIGMGMDEMLSLMHFEGVLAKSNHPMLYILSACEGGLTVLGCWIAIQIVNRILGASAQHSPTA